MEEPSEEISADRFIQQLLRWILETYGSMEPGKTEPRGPAVEVGLRLRPEQMAALGATARRRGTTPTQILNDVLDAWIAEEWAKTQ